MIRVASLSAQAVELTYHEQRKQPMKIINGIFILIFLLSAALQYNDPDPLVWMALYLYGAVLCFLALRRSYPLILYVIGLVVYLSYATYLFFADDGVLAWINEHQSENIVQSMKADKPWIEMAREFFGLLILVIALAFNLAAFRRSLRRTSGPKGYNTAEQ